LSLIAQVVRRENLVAAHARVVRNGGAPGVDGMAVDELMPYCRQHWARIREQLLSGTYIPQPVRRVEIPKPDGKGVRMLGIPTVLDRFIQQALLQVLSPIFDPTFSDASFGFRPGRSTHQAVQRARGHIATGHRWVVDVDLEKFFDRVNHDVLMARVARRVKDTRVLRLIRRYLQAGIMAGRSHHSSVTFCSTNGTGNWNGAGIALSGTLTTATCMCGRRRRASACWYRWRAGFSSVSGCE
jgi:RNA-directed DNA polymerase